MMKNSPSKQYPSYPSPSLSQLTEQRTSETSRKKMMSCTCISMMMNSITMPISTLCKSTTTKISNQISSFPPKPSFPITKRRVGRRLVTTTRALLSSDREAVLNDFHHHRALKIIAGLQNFNAADVAAEVTPADKMSFFSSLLNLIKQHVLALIWGGATHVDIACDPELVKLALSLT
ncbi:hypothetical protein AKJ16_DCAP08788 [Drosera capensis]